MKKHLAGLLALVVSFSFFTACGKSTSTPADKPVADSSQTSAGSSGEQVASNERRANNELVVAISSEPQAGLDPTVGWGHGTAPLVQSTLVRYQEDKTIVNDLATAYELSEDGLTWTFNLRDDAKFTDGQPVTAKDVAFTIETAQAKESSLDLTVIDSCEAKSDHEVVFHLKQPSSTFINMIASLGIVPAHLYDENYGQQPVGSGPWKFVQWNRGEQIILAANEDYYGEVPAIKQATIVFMDEDAAFAAAVAGQVDVALTGPIQATREIEGMTLKNISTLDNRGFTLPLTPNEGKTTADGYPIGNDVTSQKSIRQAMAYALDREQLAQDAVNGYATPAYSENDGMPWNNPAVKIETDVEKAKQILADDGWQDTDGDGVLEKDGLKAEFTCLYADNDASRLAVATAAAQQLETIGIKVNLEGSNWDDISKKMFSNAVMMGWGSANPYTSYLLYHSKSAYQDDFYNPEGLENKQIDAYLDAAVASLSEAEAYENWQKAQWDGETGTCMKGECPWVWMINIDHLYYVADGLDIGPQQLHAHGASWTLLENLAAWSWE